MILETLKNRIDDLERDDDHGYVLRVGTERGVHDTRINGSVAALRLFEYARDLVTGNSHSAGIYHLEIGTLVILLRSVVSLELLEVSEGD